MMMSDGLYLCKICRDRYTQNESMICGSCREQQMIDISDPPSPTPYRETITPFALENARKLVRDLNRAARIALEHGTEENKRKVSQLDMTLAGYVAPLIATIEAMREWIERPIRDYPSEHAPVKPKSDAPLFEHDNFRAELNAYLEAKYARRFLAEIDSGAPEPVMTDVDDSDIPF